MKRYIQFYTHILIIFLSGLITSCGNNSAEISSENREKAVQQIEKIPIDIVTKQDYCYYIPDSSSSKKYGLVVLFTPHGKAKDAIKKYASIARNRKVIIVASLVSKNGLSLDVIRPHVQEMLKELTNNLPVKKERIIFAGLSGGGRVAMEMSKEYTTIQGVITCGASNNPRPNLKTAVVCGAKDFNYLECVSVAMQQANNNNLSFIPFDGKHDWPPVEIMSEALLFCTGLSAKRNFKLSMEERQSLMLENKIMREFSGAFSSKDINWWIEKIDSLRASAQSGTKLEKQRAERNLAFIGILCYSNTKNALQYNFLKDAEKALQVYAYIEPENKDMMNFKEQLTQMKN